LLFSLFSTVWNLAWPLSFLQKRHATVHTCTVRALIRHLDQAHEVPVMSANDVDAWAAYLFFCPLTNRYGITLDRSGSNLPQQGCEAGWQLQAEFPLGVHEALPAPMDPEPVLRSIKSIGYFVWREGPVRNPRGTSQ